MAKACAILAVLLTALGGVTSAYAAGISVSVGEGMLVDGDIVGRTPVNFEVMPHLSVSIVKFDVGVLFSLEPPVDVVLRPGLRVDIPVAYFRAAVPLRITDPFDWGFLGGVGFDLTLAFVTVFLEIDASVYERTSFQVVPIEGRLGVELGF